MTDGRTTYGYDANGQPLPNYNFTYAFDPIGNWTKATSSAGETDFTSNDLNQYIAITNAGANPSAPQYDRDGNMISDAQGNTYVYDEEDRLVETDTPGQAAAKIVSVLRRALSACGKAGLQCRGYSHRNNALPL